jgi:hypothetical protein
MRNEATRIPRHPINIFADGDPGSIVSDDPRADDCVAIVESGHLRILLKDGCFIA